MRNIRTLKPLFDDNELITVFDPENDQIKLFYDYYMEDFVENPLLVRGKNVTVFTKNSKIMLFKDFQESFVHLITREVKSINQRFYEGIRANRIHWIKPILEAYPNKQILYYKWEDERRVLKDHFWLFDKNFMVVLKEYKPNFQIITAFCVDEDMKLTFFERYKEYNLMSGNV
ncbi:MAG: hypothetical protein NT144_07325 [Bacteroidia bacterium]|nr:hypothetical protein [Bacteroidia bacterium]